MMKKHLPFMFAAGWFPSLVFMIHCVLSLGFDAYDRLPGLDIPMHLLGGVAIAHFFRVSVAYLVGIGVLRIGGRPAMLLIVFGLVASATVAWEIAEFLADAFFEAGAQRNLADTMKDQFNGIVGGVVYLGLAGRIARAAPLRPDAVGIDP